MAMFYSVIVVMLLYEQTNKFTIFLILPLVNEFFVLGYRQTKIPALFIFTGKASAILIYQIE